MSTPFEDGRPFPTKFRGFDPAEVRRFVEQRDAQLADLQREKDQLVARLEQLGETSIDFDSFADELRLILEAAHQAADTLRKRASDEVSTWRDMAAKEVEQTRADATEAAENLRRDAWTASETLVKQSQAESKTEVEGAARESLAIVGKAERDSHRIQSNARRESEEVMRLARMEAERMMVDARAQHDEVVEQARKQADAAQERARALEVRRAELLTELDSVQVAVARLEDDLKRKREELEAAPQPVLSAYDEPSGSVKVLETDEEPSEWNTDAIKLIPAEKKVLEPASIPVDASEMAEEVRLLNDSRASSFADIKIIPADAVPLDDGPSAPTEPESAAESDTDPADTGDPAPDSPERVPSRPSRLSRLSQLSHPSQLPTRLTNRPRKPRSLI